MNNEKPILFSGPMVRAILDGRKTMTRRVVKEPIWTDPEVHNPAAPYRYGNFATTKPCPYGEAGDRLWVREAWRCGYSEAAQEPYIQYREGGDIVDPKSPAEHNRMAHYCTGVAGVVDDAKPSYRPSIHLPRWASRILLEVVSVRIESLHDISEDDAIAEGIEGGPGRWKSYEVIHEGPKKGEPHPHSTVPNRMAVTSFRELWQSINGVVSWGENPFVWVVEFNDISKCHICGAKDYACCHEPGVPF